MAAFDARNLRDVQIWIMDANGDMVPMTPVRHYSGSTAKPERITCLPTPGRNGVEYVPDWFGITTHG
jgi:hypothetical protein